jgi:hypothetical protein
LRRTKQATHQSECGNPAEVSAPKTGLAEVEVRFGMRFLAHHHAVVIINSEESLGKFNGHKNTFRI